MDNKYSDNELREMLINFIEKADRIMYKIENKADELEIKEEYKELKKKVKEEAHRMDLQNSRKEATEFEESCYRPAIQEASAWGFTVSTNSKVNQAMWRAVEEAHYKLNKYISLEELKKMKFNDREEKNIN
ncbi:MAG: hypothetical protein HFJ40_00755 [Clostridia bacterium]|nr:hypothetical protein [Clostridia bacterium]